MSVHLQASTLKWFVLAVMTLGWPLGIHAVRAADSKPALQFKDLGGVRSWKAGGDTIVFVKNRADKWFKAVMTDACMALDTKKGIKFITERDPETEERVSAVVVDRHICRVTSLMEIESPPPETK